MTEADYMCPDPNSNTGVLQRVENVLLEMFICPEYGEVACASSLNEGEIVWSSSLDARRSRASKQY